jgi:hypothetical protein
MLDRSDSFHVQYAEVMQKLYQEIVDFGIKIKELSLLCDTSCVDTGESSESAEPAVDAPVVGQVTSEPTSSQGDSALVDVGQTQLDAPEITLPEQENQHSSLSVTPTPAFPEESKSKAVENDKDREAADCSFFEGIHNKSRVSVMSYLNEELVRTCVGLRRRVQYPIAEYDISSEVLKQKEVASSENMSSAEVASCVMLVIGNKRKTLTALGLPIVKGKPKDKGGAVEGLDDFALDMFAEGEDDDESDCANDSGASSSIDHHSSVTITGPVILAAVKGEDKTSSMESQVDDGNSADPDAGKCNTF